MSAGLLHRIMALLGASHYTTNGREIIFYTGAGARRYVLCENTMYEGEQDILRERLIEILRGLEHATQSIW